MSQLAWGDNPAKTFRELVRLMPKSALDSPRRSVVPLVDYWRQPDPRISHLSEVLGVQIGSSAKLVFEYAVAVQKGRGKPSFTDLMILDADSAVAIEAKYTEPEYEKVRSWLREPVKPNRSDVLDGWLALINRTAACLLRRELVLDIPYQLIHRTASACFPGRRRTALVYFVFANNPPRHYLSHLQRLDDLLGNPSGISLHLVACPLTPLPAAADLTARWDNGERLLGDSVRSELLRAPLFSFGELANLYDRRGRPGRVAPRV